MGNVVCVDLFPGGNIQTGHSLFSSQTWPSLALPLDLLFVYTGLKPGLSLLYFSLCRKTSLRGKISWWRRKLDCPSLSVSRWCQDALARGNIGTCVLCICNIRTQTSRKKQEERERELGKNCWVHEFEPILSFGPMQRMEYQYYNL